MKGIYGDWTWKHGQLMLGFEPQEWGQIEFSFMGCIQHGVIDLHIVISSFMLHFYLDKDTLISNEEKPVQSDESH